MTFQDLLRQDRDNVILNKNELAQDVVYTPKGGTAKTITAIVSGDTEHIEQGNKARISARTATAIISNDATAGIASPGTDDIITIAGEVWDIIGIEKNVVTHRLELTRKEFI